MKRLLILLTLVSLLLAACGGAAMPEMAATTVLVEQPVEAAMPTAAATYAPAATVTDSASGTSQLDYAPPASGLVIKDAELELLVSNIDQSIARVTQMAADSGGYIISSQTWYQDGFMFASLRLGIPSTEFEKALNYLRNLAVQVVRENASGQDVSAEYVDLQSKLTNLEATAARVREFLKDAKSVEESLRISQQLSELEAQIEQVKGQMRFYEGRAAFSTVTVYLTPQYPTPTPSMTPTMTPTPTSTPTPTATPAWNPGTTFGEASGVLVDMTQSTVDVTIWLVVVVGPIVLVGGLIVGVVRRLLRGRTK